MSAGSRSFGARPPQDGPPGEAALRAGQQYWDVAVANSLQGGEALFDLPSLIARLGPRRPSRSREGTPSATVPTSTAERIRRYRRDG